MTRKPEYKVLVDWFNHGGLHPAQNQWSQHNCSDNFQRVHATSLGDLDTGQTWEFVSDFSGTNGAEETDGTKAIITATPGDGNYIHRAQSADMVDGEFFTTVSFTEAVPTVTTDINTIMRSTGTLLFNSYEAQLILETDGDIRVRLSKHIDDTFTSLSETVTLGNTSDLGLKWNVRMRCVGTKILGKYWEFGTKEPVDFTLAAQDDELTSGSIGFRFRRISGNMEVHVHSVRATVIQSDNIVTTPAYVGDSTEITVDPEVHSFVPHSTLVDYTVKVAVRVPTGTPNIEVRAHDGTNFTSPVTVTLKDTWVVAEIAMLDGTLPIFVSTSPVSALSGTSYFIGFVGIETLEDDISCDVLASRTPVTTIAGRDSERDLERVRVGTLSIELNNRDKKYTPGNTLSVLFGNLTPNKNIVVFSEFDERIFTLFNGFTDDYKLFASLDNQSVNMSSVDRLARLSEITVHSDVIESARTGELVNHVLDKAGIGPIREIDPGASSFKFWGRGGMSARAILDELVQSEGPPAIYYIGENGEFIFRDRNHRLIRTRSTTVQATLNDCTTLNELNFVESSDLDFGWAEIYNVVEAQSEQRDKPLELSAIYSTKETFSIATGQSVVLQHSVANGFIDAVQPVEGVVTNDANETIVTPEEHDYIVKTGDVDVFIEKTSGTLVKITITANANSVVEGMQVRAKAISAENRVTVLRDEDSIEDLNSEKTIKLDTPALGHNDTLAIANKVLEARSTRRPTAEISMVNQKETFTSFQLGAQIGDLVTVVSDSWEENRNLHIEVVKHFVGQLGLEHRTTHFMESVKGEILPANAFILDESLLDSTDVLTF